MRTKAPSRPKLTEAQIQKTCTDLLVADGWRALRMELNFSEKKQKSVGELGMADYLYIRYRPKPYDIHEDGPDPYNARAIGWWRPVKPCQAEVMFIEWKRTLPSSLGPRATKPQLNQVNWHAKERARGALTLIAGQDFEATIRGFEEWYAGSGLARKVRAPR